MERAMTECCPNCGAPIRPKRLGVKMTPLKVRIFDAVRRSGDIGIATTELAGMLELQTITVRAHIWQINDVIDDTGYKIVSVDRRYRLVLRTPII
jgi:hypothetical protein